MPTIAALLPEDEYSAALRASAHPTDWVNPAAAPMYNLVVVGAGTAGLVAAAGAAALGAKVALVERELMGGDCLNYGCVPSKALLRTARAAHDVRQAGEFGVQLSGWSGGDSATSNATNSVSASVDFAAAMNRLRRLRAQISPNDSVARFAALGVDVFLGQGKFIATDALSVAGQTLRFKRACIATGARAAVPTNQGRAIPGLSDSGYLTNETVFSLTELPARLAIIGTGPIGCELAQAFARCGSHVTVIGNGPRVLPHDDADAASIVAQSLSDDGVQVLLNRRVVRVTRDGGQRIVAIEEIVHKEDSDLDEARRFENRSNDLVADHLIIATGRTPNVADLGLDQAGVAFDAARGILVNDRLQTGNRRIFAAGDVCSMYKFTHAADALARVVLANALFFGRSKASALTIPWCTYTDPEVAHVGLSPQQAEEHGIAIQTFVEPLAKVDRAILDGQTRGFVKLHVQRRGGRLVGATIVAAHAGEMLAPLTLAINSKLRIGALSKTIFTYPTQSEAIRRAADAYQRGRLTPRVQSILKTWFRWRR